jgi:hypothetical protein
MNLFGPAALEDLLWLVNLPRCRTRDIAASLHLLPVAPPLVIDLLILLMMLPHSSDSRCASSAAIFIRCDMHS